MKKTFMGCAVSVLTFASACVGVTGSEARLVSDGVSTRLEIPDAALVVITEAVLRDAIATNATTRAGDTERRVKIWLEELSLAGDTDVSGGFIVADSPVPGLDCTDLRSSFLCVEPEEAEHCPPVLDQVFHPGELFFFSPDDAVDPPDDPRETAGSSEGAESESSARSRSGGSSHGSSSSSSGSTGGGAGSSQPAPF